MERLALYFTIGLSIGILCGLEQLSWLMGGVIAVGLGAIVTRERVELTLLIIAVGAMVGVGRVGALPETAVFLRPALAHFNRITINSIPVRTHGRFSCTGTYNRVELKLWFEGNPPRLGSIINATGQPMPLKHATNPGQVDFFNDYRRRHRVPPITIRSYRIIGRGLYNPLPVWASIVRQHIIARVMENLPHPYSDMIVGLTIGDNGVDIPDELQSAYRTAGLTHLLVVSGSQVALIIGIASAAIGQLGFPFAVEAIGLTLLNILFFFLCGGGPSILRAVLMSELALVNKGLTNRTPPIYLMAASLTLFLLIDPTLIVDVGALLSFVATAALIWGVPSLSKRFPSDWAHWIKTAFATSIAPFVFTIPILWPQFYGVSIVGLVTNMLATVVVEALVVVGIITEIGLLVWPDLFRWGLECARVGIFFLNGIATYSAGLPLATLYLRPPPIAIPSVLALGISAWCIDEWIPHPWVQRWVIGSCVSVVAVYSLFVLIQRDPLRIVAIDVDQGDSTLIITPRHHSVLIDAGNYIVSRRSGRVVFDAGIERVLPVLNYFGIRHLDYVIVTHFDQDHIGGIVEVLKKIPTDHLFTNGRDSMHPQWDFSGITHSAVPENGQLQLDSGIRLKLFNLTSNECEKENDHSVVVKLDYGHFSMVMTGDLEAFGEQRLLESSSEPWDATVLKLGHHGSKTSTSELFLDAVNPRFAVISAGRHNHYGHPHPTVMQRLRNHHIREWGTYQYGAITVETDGNRLKIIPYRR